MEFYETVSKRQSVRVYKDKPIPNDVLNRVIGAFQAAPSWANLQPWELILVTEPARKIQLQQTVGEKNPAFNAIFDAPIVVAVIGILGRSGWYKGSTVTGRGDNWFMFDLGIAAEHLALAAAAEGMGTVHVGFFDYNSAGKILDIPIDRTVVELIPLGYPGYEPRKVPRKPLDEFVFNNSYGKKV